MYSTSGLNVTSLLEVEETAEADDLSAPKPVSDKTAEDDLDLNEEKNDIDQLFAKGDFCFLLLAEVQCMVYIH
ncbi:hypothetical protein DPMN_176305 [Dreissena polymorpha]|uniref:Uncharacterized protein n=1 Tax=Dreissena polymorpha TaxID=45954 RepID=A0A9D4E9U6_DREPO|nr:hypothetical protein DPMN_176305 [Dreissena polymorpha]